MTDLLTMVNHLLAAWLTSHASGGAWQTREVRLDESGGTIIGQLSHAAWQGEVVFRVSVEPPRGFRYTLRLTVEQWPRQMPPALEALRDVLKTAQLTLEFDFPVQEQV